MRDGKWWNVVKSNGALSATAIRKAQNAEGRGGRGFFGGGPEGALVRAAAEGNLPLVKAQGNLV